MNWSESMTPVRMRRIAIVTPVALLRDTLVRVAAAGVVDLDYGEPAPVPEPGTSVAL